LETWHQEHARDVHQNIDRHHENTRRMVTLNVPVAIGLVIGMSAVELDMGPMEGVQQVTGNQRTADQRPPPSLRRRPL
jgi:hypothetical protein